MKNLYAQNADSLRRQRDGLKVCDGCGREFNNLQAVESDRPTDNGFIWFLCPQCADHKPTGFSDDNRRL